MAKNNKMPAIRFSGYTDAWEQRKLNDLVTIRRGLTYKPSDIAENGIRVLRSSNIDEDQFITSNDDVFVNIEAVNIPFAKNGDILITSANGSNRLVGKHTIISDIADNSAVHGGFMLLAESNNSLFTDALLSSNWYKRFINTYVAGGNGAIGNLSKSDLESQTVMIPSEHEQAKIGQWYDNINQLITLHQRKLEKLKLTKKALLQKLFPKNGSNIPELRFKGFTNAWEQRKLSDISTKVTTKNVDVHYTETLTNSAEQGIISQVDFFDKEISNKDNINGYYIVENNDFIYNPRISTLAPVGPINRNKLYRTGIMSPLYTVFRASKVDLGFLEWYFQSNHWHRYMKLNGDSGARADRIAIKDSTFFDMPIKTPVNIKEQVLIGETLEKFNQYITLHQRKLEMLKNVKKGLLQKMFV